MTTLSCSTVNSNFNVDTNSQCYFIDVSGGSITATLSSYTSNYNGTYWIFSIVANNTLGTNTITFVPPSGGTISGATSLILSAMQSVQLMVYTDSNGNNNFVLMAESAPS